MEHPNPNQNGPTAVSKLVQNDQKMTKNDPQNDPKMNPEGTQRPGRNPTVSKMAPLDPFFQKISIFGKFWRLIFGQFLNKHHKKMKTGKRTFPKMPLVAFLASFATQNARKMYPSFDLPSKNQFCRNMLPMQARAQFPRSEASKRRHKIAPRTHSKKMRQKMAQKSLFLPFRTPSGTSKLTKNPSKKHSAPRAPTPQRGRSVLNATLPGNQAQKDLAKSSIHPGI